MNVEQSIIINRPVAEVFAYVTDYTRQNEWDVEVKEVRQIPEGSLGVGTKITEVRTFLGRKIESTSEITEYEPNKKFTRGGNKPFVLSSYVTFEPVANGTRLTWRFDGQPSGFFVLAEGLIANAFKKSIKAGMRKIKDRLENGAAVNQS